MTATLVPQSETITQLESDARPSLWRTGLKAGLVAAVATTAIAAGRRRRRRVLRGRGRGHPAGRLRPDDPDRRRARRAAGQGAPPLGQAPAATFVRTTVALTALSIVPDLTMGFDAASAATLVVAHVTAAAIIIPRLAARLGE